MSARLVKPREPLRGGQSSKMGNVSSGGFVRLRGKGRESPRLSSGGTVTRQKGVVGTGTWVEV